MIDAGMALKISTAINVLCGVQFYFFPDSAIKMYKVSVPVTTLGKKMFGFAGATLIALAAYLNVAAEKAPRRASRPSRPSPRSPASSLRSWTPRTTAWTPWAPPPGPSSARSFPTSRTRTCKVRTEELS